MLPKIKLNTIKYILLNIAMMLVYWTLISVVWKAFPIWKLILLDWISYGIICFWLYYKLCIEVKELSKNLK